MDHLDVLNDTSVARLHGRVLETTRDEGGLQCGILLAASILASLAATAAVREVTESAGRTVTVPPTISRLCAARPPVSLLLYVLAPDRLTG